MFQIMNRIQSWLPLVSVFIGFVSEPALLVVPPVLATAYLLLRDRIIRRRVGLAAWPSDGFARHVLVDDLGRLICLTLLGLPLFLLGGLLRGIVLHP